MKAQSMNTKEGKGYRDTTATSEVKCHSETLWSGGSNRMKSLLRRKKKYEGGGNALRGGRERGSKQGLRLTPHLQAWPGIDLAPVVV